MELKKVIAVLGMVIVVTMTASATVVTLEPIADCTVDSANPDTVFANDENLWPLETGTSGEEGHIRLSYIQFQLPSDIDVVNGADLKTVQTTNNGNFGHHVYMVKDAVNQPNAETYTWNTSPGHDPTDTVITTTYRYDSTEALYVDYVYIVRTDPIGHEYTTDISATGVAELNNDTDGIVTIWYFRRTPSATESSLASRENQTYDPVRLVLDYTPVPEPATMLLLGLGGLAAVRSKK